MNHIGLWLVIRIRRYFLLTIFSYFLTLQITGINIMKKALVFLAFVLFYGSGSILHAYGADEANSAPSDPFKVLSTANTPKKCLKENINNLSLSLSDLIEVAVCNNPTLNRSYMEAKASAATYGQSLSSYLPGIDGNADAGYSNSKTGGSGSQDSTSAGASLSLSWLLYDFGGREADVNITKKNLEAANFSRNQILQDTVFSVINAYYTLLSARELLNSSMVNEETFKKSYEIASRRYELGLVRLSDKLQAETSYAQSQLSTTEAFNALEKSKGELAEILNLPAYTALDLKEITVKPEDGEFSGEIETLAQEALAKRQDIKSQKASLEASAATLEKAKTGNYPSISLTGGLGINDDIGDNRQTYNGNIGVQLSVPLFTGFSNSYNITKQRYNYESAKAKVAESESSVRLDVWKSYQNYNTSVKNYEITSKLFISAEENERVAMGAYKAGKGNIIDLLNAQYKLAEARKEKTSALYNLILTKNDLLRSVGSMEI